MNLPTKTATERADDLVKKIIESQTSLLEIKGAPTKSDGESLGDFIAALRDRLIDMYNQKS